MSISINFSIKKDANLPGWRRHSMHQLTSQDIPEIDSWLETLFQCKQLDEETIRKLCEKVKFK